MRSIRPFVSLVFASSLSFTNAGIHRRDLVPPETIGEEWEYQGCFREIPGRALSGATIVDLVMTNEACVAECESRGFSYAGTQYYTECYCGASLPGTSSEAPPSDCSTPCGGDEDQPCGGPDRLTVFHNPNVQGPSTNPGVNGFESMGCYSEPAAGRALPHQITTVPFNDMTVDLCTAACQDAGFILAGVEYAGECFCGNTLNGGAPAAEGCNLPCEGNALEYCGGLGQLNLYSYGGTFTPPASTAGPDPTATDDPSSISSGMATETPVVPGHPPVIGDYSFYQCRTEATNMRALSGGFFGGPDMTIEACADFCDDFDYFGLEYAQECFCGNSFNPGSVEAPIGDCNMPCLGDPSQLCGAGNRLSVYKRDGASEPSGSDVPSSTETANPQQPSGLPEGWADRGCWVDGVNGRILGYQAPDSQTLTLEGCAHTCADLGYAISGAQYHTQCFCGDFIVNGGERATNQAECNTPCSGDSSQMCGGPNRLTIFSPEEPEVFEPPRPQEDGLSGDWEYVGCVEDNLGDQRTFIWQLFFPGTMDANTCLDQCAEFGYMAAGLEYGEECYCGDPRDVSDKGAEMVDESECSIVCSGDTRYLCGGLSRMTTYFWTGDPLHEWDYPQGPEEAGTYEFLIGGVVIPLIATQSITGKVSFLEKSGTGPPNSTGAYELDLDVLDDFDAAWKEMHVKTDIFCAGSVVLPDVAGRQLNVGGWSGISLEGIRLYTPDGSPGVKGPNDWEENVDVLALQDGRWYPSVMTMANGSVLVVGGEDGSNGAPVPTIEILPYTGTPPIYKDWLERTDPNNLYPFLFVLPSGGIFVSYWNEAQILDEVTLETIKTLPNMPGAVNDEFGGRTYPLEGTAVLLPQHAPYTDYLAVLHCGGSTEGVATALDNCVTIEPDNPDPEWVLERMPSQRVMSCMAALPDGTFLILNGAKHGVAGFGLATDPNLNAVLYDPKKPVGRRMSVMANTTVPRMYHSEAITLLDGRVLVSGSDPQDGVHNQEYRIEVFVPPYLHKGLPRPTFVLGDIDWAYGDTVTFTLGSAAQNGDIEVSLLGSVSSTHGNSMGVRTLFPEVSCQGTTCEVVAPPDAYVCPPGWYQFFVLDGGIPAVGVYVRIGGDPASLGEWPEGEDFTRPGMVFPTRK